MEYTDTQLRDMSDSSLAEIRQRLGKRCTPEQMALHQRIYVIQRERYDTEVAAYNQQAMEAGYHKGDRVRYSWQSMFLTVATMTGTVTTRNGRLAVRLDEPDGTGRRITRLHTGWRQIS